MQISNPFQELHEKLDYLTLTVTNLGSTFEKEKPKSKKKLIKIDEAAEFLRMPVSTIRFHIKHSRLPHIKPGKILLFREEELAKWLLDLSSGKIKKQFSHAKKTFPKK